MTRVTLKTPLGNHPILSEESIGHKWNLGHYQWWFNPWRFLNICEERKCIWEEYLCSWQSWKSRLWSNFISASGRISIYGRTFSTLAEEYFNPFLSEIIFAHISLSSRNTSTINKNCKNWDKEVTCLHRTDQMSQRPHLWLLKGVFRHASGLRGGRHDFFLFLADMLLHMVADKVVGIVGDMGADKWNVF